MQSLVLFHQKLKTSSDTGADDSDKTFTVPAGKRWIINSIWVELVTTATVGNRQMSVTVNSAALADLLSEVRAGAVQAASLTRNYLFATGVADLTSFRDTTFLTTPLPAPLELDAGEVLRVRDKGPSGTGIDAAADDMVVHLRYYEQDDI